MSEPSHVSQLVLIVLLTALAGCGRGGTQDSTTLDSMLATGRIDTVEILTRNARPLGPFYLTNHLQDVEAVQYVAAFNQTNRLPANQNRRMEHTGRIVFKTGTNEVVFFNVCDSHIIEFQDYSFTLKSSVIIP